MDSHETNCEANEVAKLRRLQELQQENENLRKALEEAGMMLDESIGMRKRAEARLADADEKCQALAAELETAKESERWIRREHDLLAAQMEIVHLIFGGRQGGGCGGCH